MKEGEWKGKERGREETGKRRREKENERGITYIKRNLNIRNLLNAMVSHHFMKYLRTSHANKLGSIYASGFIPMCVN